MLEYNVQKQEYCFCKMFNRLLCDASAMDILVNLKNIY